MYQLFPNRVWRSYTGGQTLDQLQGVAAPADGHLPEDWIASTTPAVNPGQRDPREGLSHVLHGGEKRLLCEVLQENAHELLGDEYTAQFGPRVLPLVKFLDPAVRLHFQCHPTVAFSQERLNSNFGKTEAYHILAIRPDNPQPYIYLGFQRPPSRQEMRRIILEQDMAALENCFDKIPVAVGQTYLVPGGLPHAIGPGVLMVETMEPTDFVSRFEWTKSGYTLPEASRFMGRDVDFGLDMLDFGAYTVDQIRRHYQPEARALGPGRQLLLGEPDTRAFRLEKLTVRGSAPLPARLGIGIVLSGHGRLVWDGGSLGLGPLDRFFQPLNVQNAILEAEEMELLFCLPPEIA